MKRVLLLLPTTTYRTHDFLEAGQKLGVETVVGTDRRQALQDAVPARNLTLDFTDPENATRDIARFAEDHPLDAIVGADDETTLLAAQASRRLALPANPAVAVAITRSKFLTREALGRAGLPGPGYRLFEITSDPGKIAAAVTFPCVLKPTFLSASRAVIRANDADAFDAAYHRIAGIMADPDVRKRGGEEASKILVEDYIPGEEFAVDGILTKGVFQLLAIFDKPDPLEGPTFEETIYVTPSRATGDRQEAILQAVREAVGAIGLSEGPVHAEVRANPEGIFVLEVAARSIGGRCARALRFDAGISLEELILRHAIGEECTSLDREARAAGVMMIPVPRAGKLNDVSGLGSGRKVSGVEEIDITIPFGQPVVPLPEGHRYLGFIFARADTPEKVEAALREAHRHLAFDIVPV